jgi:hypothetical protein
MAIESGITMSLSIDDSGGSARDIATEASTLDFATPREEQLITGLDHSAQARMQLLADFSATLGLPGLDDASNSTHAVFKNVSSTSVARTVTIAISGQTLAVEAFMMDYAWSRAQSGELSISVPMVLASGSVPTWA